MSVAGWKYWAVGSVAALTLMAGGLAATGNVSAASTQPVAGEERGAPSAQGNALGREDRGFGRTGDSLVVRQDLLAEALGISVEELEAAQGAAQTKAHEAALAEAVANGELTQEQADAMKELDGVWGYRQFGIGRPDGDAPFGFRTGIGQDEYDAYLAEELGITVDELQAARETARQNGLTQQVEEGALTQEQADELSAESKLREYLNTELENAWASAIAKAVEDGALTQEQADELQERWQGFGDWGTFGRFSDGLLDDFEGGRGMRGGMQDDFEGGRGMRGGMQDDFGGGRGMRGGMQDDFSGGRGMRGMPQNGLNGDNVAPDTQNNMELETEPGSTL